MGCKMWMVYNNVIKVDGFSPEKGLLEMSSGDMSSVTRQTLKMCWRRHPPAQCTLEMLCQVKA